MALEAERAAVARMSYDEEMEHWEKMVLAEGEKEDGGGVIVLCVLTISASGADCST